MLPLGPAAVTRGEEVLRRLEVVRVNDEVLKTAGSMLPVELRSLDAIHLATAVLIGTDLARVCTYDDPMICSAKALGLAVVAPS
jgi:predicted nucleic acid-binding protein